VVSAHGKGFSNSGTFNTFRFRTVVPNFYAMYYERWKRHYIAKNEYYYLYQAYLHLYHIDRVNGETEFYFYIAIQTNRKVPLTQYTSKVYICT
jgi:hypothetical protein